MQYLFLTLIFILAGIGAEVVGFGISAISMAFLPLVLPISQAIPLVALVSVIATGVVAFRTKTTNLGSSLGPLLIGSIAGIPLGMHFLQIFPEKSIMLILGIMLILTSGYSLLSNALGREIKLSFNWLTGIIVGLLAGVFGASINVNGPLVGMYSSKNKSLSKDKNKDLITTYMFITGLFVITGHYLAGRIDQQILRYFLIVMPALLIGLEIGKIIFKKVPAQVLRVIIYLFVLGAGVRLLF